ncbi:MAG: ParA family protein [Acutalibacteraceae bacterium]|nr:ParA family protein [Acutalibacteraceae bacterium]
MANKKAKIVVVALQKGGVGKSQTVLNLSTEFAGRGIKTLALDLDPQASLTLMFNITRPEELDYTIADVLLSFTKKERLELKDCILNVKENLDLAPSLIDLSISDLALAGVYGREFLLRKLLAPLLNEYEIILIDCGPSLSLLPVNALACATDVIIPCQTEYLAYRGLKLLENTLEEVKNNMNEDLNIYGVIATKVQEQTKHAQELLELLKENYNVIGVVPQSIKVSDALYSQEGAIVDYAPHSKPAIAYKQIADRMCEDMQLGKGK